MKKIWRVLLFVSCLGAIRPTRAEVVHCGVDVLRLREEPGRNGRVIGALKKGDKIDVLEESKQKTVEEGDSGYWYRVKTSSGTEGWVFGNFLEFIPFDFGIDDTFQKTEPVLEFPNTKQGKDLLGKPIPLPLGTDEQRIAWAKFVMKSPNTAHEGQLRVDVVEFTSSTPRVTQAGWIQRSEGNSMAILRFVAEGRNRNNPDGSIGPINLVALVETDPAGSPRKLLWSNGGVSDFRDGDSQFGIKVNGVQRVRQKKQVNVSVLENLYAGSIIVGITVDDDGTREREIESFPGD